MASLFSPGARAPREYNAPDIQKAFNSYSKALNVMLKDISELNQFARETRLATGKREASFEIVGTVEFYQFNSGGTEYAAGKVVIKKGWVNAVTHRYRWTVDGGNNEDVDSWSSMSFVSSSGRNTPEGGYWLAQEAIPVEETDEARSYSMQIQIQDADGSTWITGSHSFDPDYLPRLRDFSFYVGKWNPATNKWKLHLDYTGDEDTGSIKYALASSPFASDELLGDVDFTTYIDGQRQTGVELAEVDATPFAGPDVSYYIIARARSDNSSAPVAGANGEVIWRREVKIPLGLNDPSVLDNGSVIAQKLEDSLQRADVNLSMSHNGIDPDNKVDYSGSISYADNVVGPYAVSGTIDLSATTGIQHIYFDPSVSTTTLQIGTAADAHSISGRRVFVAVMEKASEVGERAFFVHNNEVAITAPYVYAASLSAITANLGTITAGTIEVTATVEWGAVSGTTNAPEDGATLGANWASNLTNIPVRFAEGDTPSASGLYASPSYMGFYDATPVTGGWKTYMDILGNFALQGAGTDFLTWNSTTSTLTLSGSATLALSSGSSIDFADVTGATKPADNATVGADWTSNLTSVPVRFLEDDSPSAAGLYLAPSYMGFHNGDGTVAGWKTYMDAGGNFYLSGTGSNSLTWNGATLAINGDITATGNITAGTVVVGEDAGGVGSHGLYLDSSNYFYLNTTPDPDVGLFQVGNGSKKLLWDGTDLTITGDISLNAYNYWTQGGDFRVGGSGAGNYMFWDQSAGTMTISGDILDAAGNTIFNATTTNLTDANLVNLDITGNLNMNGGSITATNGTYTMTLDSNFFKLEYPTVFNATITSSGFGVSTLFPVVDSRSASLTSNGLSMTGPSGLVDININSTTISDTSIAFGAAATISTASGDLALAPTGNVTIGGNRVLTTADAGGGTVTSVTGTGTAGGLSLSGTVTTAGNITLSGTLNITGGTDDIVVTDTGGNLVTSGIDISLVNNGNIAYGWGNHASAGYLTSYTETDPVFGASAAAGITAPNITNWNTAYSWGNHATAGYVTSAGTGLTKVSTTLSIATPGAAADAWPSTLVAFDGDNDYVGISMGSFGATLVGASTSTAALTSLGLNGGVSGSFNEMEFRNVGGGTGTEFRSRTNTLTNGIVTAQGTWGAWTEVVAVP